MSIRQSVNGSCLLWGMFIYRLLHKPFRCPSHVHIDVEAHISILEEIRHRLCIPRRMKKKKTKTRKKYEQRKMACGKLILRATSSGTSVVCSIFKSMRRNGCNFDSNMQWDDPKWRKYDWQSVRFFFLLRIRFEQSTASILPRTTEPKIISWITITINTLF